MEIRADYAIWAATSLIVIIQRLNYVPKADADRSKYVAMKWVTWIMDYVYLFGSFYILDTYVSGANFTADKIVLHQLANTFLVCFWDVVKALLFWNLIPKAKTDHLILLAKGFVNLFTLDGMKKSFNFLGKVIFRGEGLWNEFSIGKAQRTSIHHQLWYICKIGVIVIPGFIFLQANLGAIYWLPLNETVLVVGEGQRYELHISRFCVVYAEFLVLTFMKDGISMNILHQMFHSIWYSHHKIHHLPMKELCMFNAFYFDVPDLVVENAIGAAVLCSLKYLFGVSPQVHYGSMLLSLICDQHVHSLNPYTISCWNPLFDDHMRPCVSHNLHHAINSGHYTIWPLHQIKGMSGPKYTGKNTDGIDHDIREYNKAFGSNFPVDL